MWQLIGCLEVVDGLLCDVALLVGSVTGSIGSVDSVEGIVQRGMGSVCSAQQFASSAVLGTPCGSM